ncbi:hypothetical protein ACJX0J_032169 [Zea mays]
MTHLYSIGFQTTWANIIQNCNQLHCFFIFFSLPTFIIQYTIIYISIVEYTLYLRIIFLTKLNYLISENIKKKKKYFIVVYFITNEEARLCWLNQDLYMFKYFELTKMEEGCIKAFDKRSRIYNINYTLYTLHIRFHAIFPFYFRVIYKDRFGRVSISLKKVMFLFTRDHILEIFGKTGNETGAVK